MPTCSYSTLGIGVGAVVGSGIGGRAVVETQNVFGCFLVDVLILKSGPPESPWQESFPPEFTMQ